MFGKLGTGELIVILVILLLVFGARKLPNLARSLGASAKELRKGFGEQAAEEETASGTPDPPLLRADGQDPG